MANEQANNGKVNEKIFAEFQQLRNEQRNLVNSLNIMETDLKEHQAVIATLETVDKERKCFRLIGGVLCERTVKDVLPQLMENATRIEKCVKTINEDLMKKGVQINKFKEEHNIKIGGGQMSSGDSDTDVPKSENRNVLVSS